MSREARAALRLARDYGFFAMMYGSLFVIILVLIGQWTNG